MKSFIQNINKTLLEKFPLIWNTRLLWISIIALFTHLLFFFLGTDVFNNRALLQEYYADRIYTQNGILFFSIICSVLIIVVWLIVLFRNNSFKNFYPTSSWQLFSSFVIYFIIFLLCTSFYSSYIFGYTSYISKQFPDKKLLSMIDSGNLAGTFLSFSQDDYTIDRRLYPTPFDTLYCETNENQVDFNKPFLQRFNDEFQFYTIITKTVLTTDYKTSEDARVNSIGQLYISDSVTVYKYRGKVIDVSAIAGATLSYYNYSKILFSGRAFNYYDEHGATRRYFSDDNEREKFYNSEKNIALNMNKQVYELLKRNDEAELKALLNSLLETGKAFAIETNLTTEKWLSLINRTDYNVEKFVTKGRMLLGEEYSELTDGIATTTEDKRLRDTPENRNKKEQFYKERKTDYYFDATSLETAFDNIRSIKEYNHWKTMFPIQYWLAFGLSILLFLFRTTGLPALLFSIISSFTIAILIALVVMGLRINDEVSVAYMVFIVSTIISLLPLLLLKRLI